MKKLTIEEMHKLAQKREGKCLSSDYINARTKLLWKCDNGHEWRATPDSIKRGSWCKICGYKKTADAKRLSIEEMNKIAESRGGKCLSDNYVDAHTKIIWSCSKGHHWEAKPNSIQQGQWCPECSGKKKLKIQDMHRLAKYRGGKCLSSTYVNVKTKLLWECSEGHRWKAAPNNIQQGKWCAQCSGRMKLSIDEMQQIAKEKGGKCLSKKYENNQTKLLWECSKGHRWKAIPNIKRGSWCPYCAGRGKTIKDMQKLAKKRGGKCISSKFLGARTKLLWKCAKGHNWKATPDSIRQGSWCLQCSGSRKHTIEEMRQFAEKQGGKCLSERYLNNSSKLLWECSKGHQWRAVYSSIQSGKWCPVCRSNKYTIEQMKELAKKHDGLCLSPQYVNLRTELLWQCRSGHQWKDQPRRIKNGGWCRECRKKNSGLT
jgi:hypothetical protein